VPATRGGCLGSKSAISILPPESPLAEARRSKPVGPSVIVYEPTFSDLVSDKYQKVSGTLAGEQHTTSQDPPNPAEAPVRAFGISFKGQRITAE
jgi:hypothetical protein